jgi:hypothetical protein
MFSVDFQQLLTGPAVPPLALSFKKGALCRAVAAGTVLSSKVVKRK